MLRLAGFAGLLLVLVVVFLSRKAAVSPTPAEEVGMLRPTPGSSMQLSSEVAERIREVASGRERVVVYLQQLGDSPLAAETHDTLRRLLAADRRIVFARLADGVSVPEPPGPGGGYSEAIGLRIPTPAPDVTVQITASEGGVEVYAVRNTGPERSEHLLHLHFPG
jgi:hypothetical protein